MKNLFLTIILFLTYCAHSQNNSSLAESYFREGAYEKASQLFETLEKNNPFNTRYLKRLITCYQETNNYEKQNMDRRMIGNSKIEFDFSELSGSSFHNKACDACTNIEGFGLTPLSGDRRGYMPPLLRTECSMFQIGTLCFWNPVISCYNKVDKSNLVFKYPVNSCHLNKGYNF